MMNDRRLQTTANHEWALHVIRDLEQYFRENGMPSVADELSGTFREIESMLSNSKRLGAQNHLLNFRARY